MNAVFLDFLSDLDLEKLEENIFRGRSREIGGERIFGGQVLGQSLMAAGLTVAEDRIVHSYHGYFLRPGDATKPVVYDVDPSRDGRSFTSRRVVAIQGGKPIFHCSVSFQKEEEGFEHQLAMPEVSPPEELQPNAEVLQTYPDSDAKTTRLAIDKKIPIEMRHVDLRPLIEPVKQPAQQHVWFKPRGTFSGPLLLHQSILAYASDFNLAGTCAFPHGVSGFSGEWSFSSLDHAMWFHAPMDMNDWHLYVMDSPVARGSRGLNRGSIYNREGTLVVSATQEALVRWVGEGERPS